MLSMLHSCYCPMVAVALSNSLLSIVNNLSLVPQCLSASCGALALAANSRSLVVGCCLSGVAASGKALAANSHSLAVGCCLSGVAC